VLVPNKAGLITYNGRFIASDIKAFVFSKIPDLVVPLRRSAAVDELMHACGASTSKGKGMQSAQGGKHEASWGLCAVLVTDKDESPPLLRSIALQYRGKVCFNECSCEAPTQHWRGRNSESLKRFALKIANLTTH
jgi:hypothetical protein